MESPMDLQQFWNAISILIRNYHTINRKLCACVISEVKIREALSSDETESDVAVNTDTLFKYLQNIPKVPNNCRGFLIYFKCLPKKNENSIRATGIVDFPKSSFHLSFESDAVDDFQIKFCKGQLNVENLNPLGDTENGTRWSEYILKPKLIKWSSACTDNVNVGGSLRLVDIEKYNSLYNEFKKKYGERAMTLWNEAKESTDPLKFIYEDLAIAAYLIALWQSDTLSHSPTAFADLGCGNGLLVYILNEEGYAGYGYDVRSRKIWSFYPPNVVNNLKEETIDPSTFRLPPDVDWIIGNHSDELSPWIPVLAGRSSYRMNFFLLPCCAFEFSGRKFQRRNSALSTYNDFCCYAEYISNHCGFETERDRLKIPSTKRIAFIGRRRNYSSTNHSNKVEEIKQIVENEKQLYPNTDNSEIKLREKVETVRNCTQIDKTVIDNIVLKIFLLLLNQPNVSQNPTNTEWLVGRSLTMPEIAIGLQKEDLKQIKSECGGLKTLLRNKHEIFELSKPDVVKIRKPQALKNVPNNVQTVKKRACFFYTNHPQGCPLSNEACSFIH
ncbi:probable tRNA (uracil-O(2)-)-methyltransferase [Musca vetustissima]|uniref:probable tRNA (uracil-O(2)-)-methyltransferase n=1 Tax=Musca vetustissima TaxID=27455 RepID=UPI002AB6B380|nr:probable tRNA (uracil-O(2)-)-methyltransferase [Musca vetustissima]